MEPSKWPEVLRGEKKDRQKNLKLVKEILNTDICLTTPCSKSIADHLEFWVDWDPRWDLGGDQKAPHQPPPHLSSPHPWLTTVELEPSFRTVGSCALRPSHSDWADELAKCLPFNFSEHWLLLFSVSCHFEHWNGKLNIISKVQMEPLVYSVILYTKWSCRRLKICKGLPKIQTHYSFQQIWQILNYINFWTFFFLVHSC